MLARIILRFWACGKAVKVIGLVRVNGIPGPRPDFYSVHILAGPRLRQDKPNWTQCQAFFKYIIIYKQILL